MQMNEFDRDFVERTKWIIQNVDCKYEVTLLLNCMLGLVNLPIEQTGNTNGDKGFKNACVQKLEEMNVIKEKADKSRLFRSPRNAVSHLHICPTSTGDSIEKIILSDMVEKNAQPHTQLEFTVEQLREFALFVADKHLERLDMTSKKRNGAGIPKA